VGCRDSFGMECSCNADMYLEEKFRRENCILCSGNGFLIDEKLAINPNIDDPRYECPKCSSNKTYTKSESKQ